MEFLEARIAERESAVRAGTLATGTAGVPDCDDKASLRQLSLDECGTMFYTL